MEAKKHKAEFIDYCSDVLMISHSNISQNFPDQKEKNAVLQKVIKDPKDLEAAGNREPTVVEYGKYIKMSIPLKRDIGL